MQNNEYNRKVFNLSASIFKPLVFGLSADGLRSLKLYEPTYNIRMGNDKNELYVELDLLGPKYIYSRLDWNKLLQEPDYDDYRDDDWLGQKSLQEFADKYFPGKKPSQIWDLDIKPLNDNETGEIKLYVTGYRKQYLGKSNNPRVENWNKEKDEVKTGTILRIISLTQHSGLDNIFSVKPQVDSHCWLEENRSNIYSFKLETFKKN